MKRTAFLLLISAYLFNGCHSNTPSANSGNTAAAKDTAKAHGVVQQAADTTIKDGVLIKKYPSGIIEERSNYVAGRRQGECQSFFPNGRLRSDDFFTAGVIDGTTTVYYNNGQKEYEGACTKGKPSGVWNFYDDKGKLTHSTDYSKKKDKPVM